MIGTIFGGTWHVNPLALNVVIGSVVPAVAAFLTKRRAPEAVKYVLMTLLSVVAGALSVAATSGGVIIPSQWLLGIAATFGTAITAHYGIYLPTGTSKAIIDNTPHLGVGPKDGTPVLVTSSTMGTGGNASWTKAFTSSQGNAPLVPTTSSPDNPPGPASDPTGEPVVAPVDPAFRHTTPPDMTTPAPENLGSVDNPVPLAADAVPLPSNPTTGV